MLRRFILKALALGGPFIVVAAMIVVIDPYNFWRVSGPFRTTSKSKRP